MAKYLDYNGLSYFWNKIKSNFAKASDLKQSDWNQSDTTAIDYIKNKPSSIDEVFVCHYNATNRTMDKTVQEIYDAYSSGKVVVCFNTTSLHVYYLETSGTISCRFRTITNIGSSMTFDYIAYNIYNSWFSGSDSWASKANAAVTPTFITTNDITDLTTSQLSSLRLADSVTYSNHTYIVSYKTSTDCYLTYCGYEKIEEVRYEKVSDAWSYVETKQRQF